MVRIFALASALLLLCGSGQAMAQAPGKTFRDCGDCPEMVAIPGGSFRMGDDSAQARSDERPVHAVTIRAFAAGRTEVTHAEYAAFARATGRDAPGGCTSDRDRDGRWSDTADATWIDPGFPVTDRHPVTCVTWADASAYAAWLGQRTGKHYRLLSEAEWEYADRAGTTTQFPWGDDPDAMCAFANGPDEAVVRLFPRWKGAHCDDGQPLLAPVASYKPNAFGLYDMAGNAWEWTADCYAPSYGVQPADGTAYVVDGCPRRALKGGSWVYGLADLRSAQRNGLPRPEQRGADIGFRIARDL
jgi:formylglycine-generating enzyme required for sulfatase activity